MNTQYELPLTFSEIQKLIPGFDKEHLQIDFAGKIILDLIESGGGGLSIYEIYFNEDKIGSAWSKCRQLVSASFTEGFKYSNQQKPPFFYSTITAYRTSKEAENLSDTSYRKPYYFDEYWWNAEDTCGDAFFPTFDTLEQLIRFHLKGESQ